MIVDLHMHSNASDGVLTPTEVMSLAKKNSCEIISLTDHDTFLGIDEARVAAKELGIKFISGVEVSCLWARKTIHIVGLGLDNHNRAVVDFFADAAQKREKRAQEVAERFDKLGIYGTYEGAREFAGSLANISRPHFARYLVKIGVVKNVQEAFDRYLRDSGPCFVETAWPSVSKAVEYIVNNGGVAVLAHPGRYKYSSEWMVEELLKLFKDSGGEAIEVASGSQSEHHNLIFADYARRMGFLASTGSDFHSLEGSRPLPGKQVQIPDDLVGVWTKFF